MNDRTYITPTEVCTLVAHEAVVLLDAVESEVPSCAWEFRTALETLNAVHHLGSDGQALLSWLDAEIASAERFAADGTNLPNLIDTCQLDTVPDAVAQMELVWLLFDAAATEECGPEQRRALVDTARTITEMCGLDDLLLGTLKPNVAKLAEGLNAELADVHAELHASAGASAGPTRQGPEEEPAPPAAPAM